MMHGQGSGGAPHDTGAGLHTLSLALSLFVFWVLLSGYFTPFLLSAGVGAAIAVAWLARRMAVADREGHPIHFLRAVLFYW
ncbi:MAG: hypothetical protein FJY37_06545, partial [Betaproteobacteria bacterium]|nr:hypothetical protein [Betaproteobacteria bacterium]